MAVDVGPLNILGGGGLPRISSVNDTFNRNTLNPTDRPFRWLPVNIAQFPTASPFAIGDAGATTNGLGATYGLQLSGFGLNNPTYQVPMILPCLDLYPQAYTAAQYVQGTMVGFASNSTIYEGGLAVAIDYPTTVSGDTTRFYAAMFTWPNDNKIILARFNIGSTLTRTDIASTTPAYANGDVFRLSVVFDAVNGSTITLLKNGVSFLSGTDTVAGSLLKGLPGFHVVIAGITGGNANVQQWKDVTAGLGA
jgi:hypothetical protein